MDTFAIVAFALSTFGLIGFAIATAATTRLSALEKEVANLRQRLDEVATSS